MAVRPDDYYMQDDLATNDASMEQSVPKNRRRGDRFEDDGPATGRVSGRRSLLPKTVWGRSALAAGLVVVLGTITAGVLTVRGVLLHDDRFSVGSSESIEIRGNAHVSRADLLSVFGADLERNIFHVPLAERRADLEKLPWVKHATVMRLLPDRLSVRIEERTPVAFLRQGAKIGMVDASGVLLDMPPEEHYSFPVVTGISANDPASVRAARMKLYMDFMKDMDSSGPKVSEQLSEVDISSPEDVKALIPEGSGDVLVHFGDSDYLTRYRKFEQHLPEWRTQYPRLSSVDMRYDRQVVLEMQPGTDTTAQSADKNVAAAAPANTAAAVAKNNPPNPPKAPAVSAKLVPAAVKPAPAMKPAAMKPNPMTPVESAAKPAVASAKPTAKSSAKTTAKPAAKGSAKDVAKAKKAAATKAMLERGRILKAQQQAAQN